MMKAAIVSDSHDNAGNLNRAALLANQHNCGWLFHLGDVTTPAAASQLSVFRGIVRGVFGNSDGDRTGLTRAFSVFGGDIRPAPFSFDIEGLRIVLMHEPDWLEQMAGRRQFDYIFYGHSHRFLHRGEGDVQIINPGAVGGNRGAHSLAIVDLVENTVERLSI